MLPKTHPHPGPPLEGEGMSDVGVLNSVLADTFQYLPLITSLTACLMVSAWGMQVFSILRE